MISSELIPIDKFGKICRLCLKEQNYLKPIYEKNLKQTCVIEMLMACIGIWVIEDHRFPAQICSKCIQEINQAYSLVQKCKKSEDLLRRSLFEFEDKIVEAKKIVDEQTKEILNYPNEVKHEEVDINDEVEYFLDCDELSNVDEVEQVIDEEKIFVLVDDEIYEDSEEDISSLYTKPSLRNVTEKSKKGLNRKTCTICKKSVVSTKMKDHMRIHTSEKPYRCNVCDARFSQNGSLHRHLRAHSNIKPHKCELCDKAYAIPAHLREHVRTHTGEKPFVCQICGSAFARHSGIRQHMRGHMVKVKKETGVITTKDHQCSQCQKRFATKEALRLHVIIHGEKRFLCSECGKSFVTMPRLKSHFKIHTGAQPYSCHVCHKRFRHMGSFNSHMLIHTGQRPYTCSECKATFIQRTHLKYHMKTHSGEKNYVCSICGKCFALNGNLVVHMRIHTGERPYVCSVCGRGFYDSSTMKKHKKSHFKDTEKVKAEPKHS